MCTETPPLETIEIRRLAVECESDPRSVAKELRGERVRGIAGERIRRVLRQHDLPTSETQAEAA
jgi:hypothetical protein